MEGEEGVTKQAIQLAKPEIASLKAQRAFLWPLWAAVHKGCFRAR